LSVVYFRELIAFIILLSLIVLFVVAISVNLVSFNLYSLVSSTFNYFILLILQTITYNSIFSFLYIIFYTYLSFVLYYTCLLFAVSYREILFVSSFNPLYLNATVASSGSFYLSVANNIFSGKLNLMDIISLSLFSYILYTSLFVYLLLLSGLVPLFIFFLKLFFVIAASTSYFFFIILLSFIIFFLYSFTFLNLILSLSFYSTSPYLLVYPLLSIDTSLGYGDLYSSLSFSIDAIYLSLSF